MSFHDAQAFSGLSRISDLARSHDGTRLVVTVQTLNRSGTSYESHLWEIDPEGGEPWHVADHVTSPVFQPDGGLLFLSAERDPRGENSLWTMTADGTSRPVAQVAGGVRGLTVASDSGTTILTGALLAGSTMADDAERRSERRAFGVGAVLHDGMPVRHPFHELDVEFPHLFLLTSGGVPDADLRDLTPDAGRALVATNALAGPPVSLSADGGLLVTPWSRRIHGGGFPAGLAVIDTATGKREVFEGTDEETYFSPRISPDGLSVAVLVRTERTFERPVHDRIRVFTRSGDEMSDLVLGERHPGEWTWSPDSGVLYVSGDLQGRGAIVAYDPATGQAKSTLTRDAVYRKMSLSPDGHTMYALRATVDEPVAPVRLDTTAAEQEPLRLLHPATVPPLPGELLRVSCPLPDGKTVSGWLCLPDGATAESPAPVLVIIHGGPLASHNSWSWRQNPWVFAAHGWAVLLPDPGLSTGYGPEWIQRAWPHRAERVWRDVESLLDSVGERADVDADRAACLGASFGGFMTNWIAGHSRRFGAIVTHAGLYALEQHHDTTDMAYLKNQWFGTAVDHPDWYAQNSPERFADQITTPMVETNPTGVSQNNFIQNRIHQSRTGQMRAAPSWAAETSRVPSDE